jgi:hypothetical protein
MSASFPVRNARSAVNSRSAERAVHRSECTLAHRSPSRMEAGLSAIESIRICSGLYRLLCLVISLSSGLLAFSSTPIYAQCGDVCLPNEVVVDEGPTWCRCRDKHKYALCVNNAGRALKNQIQRQCGQIFVDCFHKHDLAITAATGDCVALALVGCGRGKWACVSACGGITARVEYLRALQCEAEATPCFEKALADDRQRKEACKQEED